MARDEFWDAMKDHAKQTHTERISKNPDRIAYAIQQFQNHGIEYQLKNEQTGHFHCWRKSDDRLFQFYAGTGKIQGFSNVRGIHALIRLLEGDTVSGYGSVSSSYYAPDPAMVYWDQKEQKEREKAKLLSISQKYYADQKLLEQAGFNSVAELIETYQDMQKYHAHDADYIDQLRCEILELSGGGVGRGG